MRDGQRINELLRECRERAGLTQKELAALLGMDRTNVVKVETGDIKNPSYTMVKEWARVTKGEDLVGIDLTGGRDGWKRLRTLEGIVNQVKSAMEAVNLKKRKA